MILDLYKGKIFSHICHVSDIHIRLFKRHEEYKEVFKNLYSSIRNWEINNNWPEFCVVVSGDIVHAKTDMSPEMVDVASDFLRSLADIAPTFVIAGNHDMNLANPHRLDALSPIIENISHDHLHYLKDSGIYEVGNISFAVHSIVGEKSDWPQASDIKSGVKVALYHGPVINARTDTGYIVTGRHVDLKTFDGYDAVLLGDIHRHQTLQHYAPTLGKPVVAYAGSLVQQNHGESLEYHGWVSWDLNSKDCDFNQVVNDIGYATIEVSSGKALQLPPLPKKIRLRLFVDNIDAAGVKKILSLIRKKHDVLEVAVNKISSLIKSSNDGGTSNIVDVHDVEYQSKLIKEYINSYYPDASQDVIEKIIEINKDLNSRIHEDDLPRNVHWKPLYLRFDNLFSYGKGNEIDFENMNGLYGVFSPNATGKTSAFDALCFALYDKTPRAFKGSHIMNTRESDCYCELEFEVNNSRYKIIRKGTRRKNNEVKIDVEFHRMDNGEWVNMNGEDRRDTNSIIRSYVGDYEDFVLTNLSVQNQNALFIDKGQSERKDLLSQFMGLTIFDRLYDMASEEIKEISGTLKRFNRDDFTKTLTDTQTSIEDLEDVLEDDHQQLLDAKSELEKITNEIIDKHKEKHPVAENIIDVESLLEEKERLSTHIDSSNKRLDRAQSAIEDMQEKISDLSNHKSQYTDTVVKWEEFKSLKEKETSLTNTKSVLDVQMKEWKIKIDGLKTHEYDPNCRYCMNNIFVKDAYRSTKLYEDNLPAYNGIISELGTVTGELHVRKNIEQDYKELLKIQSELSSLDKSVLQSQLTLNNLQSDISSLELKKNECEKQIEEYEEQKESIKFNKEIELTIRNLESNRNSLSSSIEKMETSYQNNHSELKVLQSKKEELLARIKEAEDLESTYEAYEYYLWSICRDGIPYQLISEVIPAVQNSVNNTLSQIVDFNVDLEVDGKNINGRIVYGDERVWPLELASGMEKFVTGLAIRVALMSISSLPKSNFLVIDEGVSVLDSENLASMSMLFDMLKGEFEFIVLISHLDIVRDIADTLIEIKREDGYSYIKTS